MINYRKQVRLLCLMLFPCVLFAQKQGEHLLWYRQPAKEWVEALPVGNGAMGAMVFGGSRVERIQVNEESIWSGKPEPKLLTPDYADRKKKARDLLFAGKHEEAEKLIEDLKKQEYTGSDAVRLNGVTVTEHGYETAGDLFFYFDAAPEQEKNYRRQLDLRTAIATTTYQRAGVNYKEEVFCSYPDKVLVIKLEADSQNALGLLIKPDRPVTAEEEIGNFVAPPTNLKNVYPPSFQAVSNDHFIMRGRASNEGVSFETHLRIMTNGTLNVQEGGIKVSKASSVIILVHINSDYYGVDPGSRAKLILDKALHKGYDSIRADHIMDHGSLYNRMEIDIGKGNTQYPLDVRIRNVRNDNEDNRAPKGRLPDPGLLALFYQFNRYLMIASSRPDTLPPALHFWNHSLYATWYGRPTTNINQQMNYWPAEVANLSECHLTMLNMLERFLPAAKEIASKGYHCKGAVLPGRGISLHGPEFIYDTWNDAGAWFGAHFYDHYRFTGDRAYLKAHAYPYMKEMSLFYLDFLTMHPDSGYLVTGPSYSSENRYMIGKNIYNYANGVTLSKAIIHEILCSTLEAARILDTDSSFRDKIKKVIPLLAPYKISKQYNILQEWDDDFAEVEPGHRHLSHLYSVYPGYDITEDSGPLYIAARNALNRRLDHGSGWTGWSRAWIACLAARFKDGQLAGEQVNKIVRSLVFPNFMTTNKRGGHDVYTMDGNFGSLAAMSEMLLQSHQGFIELLPALPPNWESGYIKGLCGRGGLVIDIYWEKGKLTKAVIQSRAGTGCKIRYKGKSYLQKIAKGGSITFYPE
jgi:alpha-L-fucosidase 2